MRYNPTILRQIISTALPPGLVVAEHTEHEHFYRVHQNLGGQVVVTENDPLYPSVTGDLQMLKDEGLINFKMARALEYVFAHFKEFNDDNIMEHLGLAEKMPGDIFVDAGDVGTRIHDVREHIFTEWINTGVRPEKFEAFIPEHDTDLRVQSAIAALSKFCDDYKYLPIATELKVYSHKFKKAGTLDDLGLMRTEVRKGDANCVHDVLEDPNRNFDRCVKCGAKWKWEFVMLDLKTSNRFKDSYFFQVSMYFSFLRALTGLKPDSCHILKLSKEDRTYKLEDLKKPVKIAQYVRHIVKVNEGLDLIKSLRKDNQRNVISI